MEEIEKVTVIEIMMSICYNEFVTVTLRRVLFSSNSRLSVRASGDCDKHWKQQVGGSLIRSLMRKIKSPISLAVRQEVFERDKYACCYCGDTKGPFSPDHVYPESRGGETSVKNLVTACRKCNSKKGSKVGVHPLPIGYFENQKGVTKKAVFKLKQEGTLIFVNLVPSGFMLATMWLFPSDAGWVAEKILIFIWFVSSLTASIHWVWDFLKR